MDAIRHPFATLSGDRGNIGRLAEHLQCSQERAEAVYRLARRTGYASAYRAVFGSETAVPPTTRRRRVTEAHSLPAVAGGVSVVGAANGRSA